MQIQTHPSFSACYHYLQVSKDRIKSNQEKVEIPFPHYKSMGVFFRATAIGNRLSIAISLLTTGCQ